MKPYLLLEFEDIRVRRSGNSLTIANSAIVREFDLSAGAPRTVSLRSADGREFASPDKPCADLSFIGLTAPGNEKSPWRLDEISAELQEAGLFDAAGVRVRLKMSEPIEQAVYIREYIIYPRLPVLAVRNTVECPVKPNIYWTKRGVYARNQQAPEYRALAESCADSLRPAPGLHPECTVEFIALTDITDERVAVHPAADAELLNGNLLFCSAADGAGITLLQEAPPSGERRDYEEHDFRVSEGTIFSCNWGIHPSELIPGKVFHGYRHVLMLFHSRPERDHLLKQYLRLRFPSDPSRHSSIMVNPWGCGCLPKLMGKQFLLDEIAATPELGATHYQIDDSWQTGGSLGELSSKNRKVTPEFWSISDDRLDGTFAPAVEAAAHNGVEPALWLAPSANSDYDDWREFAAMVLDYHRRFGFRVFKIDFMKLRTSTAETNLRELFTYLRTASGGDISFNLDITNGQRTGYLHFLEFGNIFLENRYVNLSHAPKYHPEKTLRSLWCLSRFIRPQTLQIEIPNPEDIDPTLYPAGGNPGDYPVEYWCAVALFTSPLLWLAPSLTSPSMRRRIRVMMDLHSQYRDRISAGEIFAVGAEPDGSAITALQSHDFAAGTGLVIVYRERGNTAGQAVIPLNYLPKNPRWQLIYGQGEAATSAPGELHITLPQCPGFALMTYQ